MSEKYIKPIILIVDDEEFVRTAFQDIMNSAGFSPFTASDGESALSMMPDLQPDLVLLDLIMPGKDGFETCKQIRTSSATKHIPILMTTCLDDTESIHRAFEAGATDFISKPVKPELLVYRVCSMLRASAAMKKLLESEERLIMLKEAVDSLPIGITLIDVEGKITYSNPAEAEMHGYTVGDLVGKEARQFAPEALRMPLSSEKLEKIGLWKRETVNIRKDGTQFPVQLSSVAVKDASGKCLGMVTACEDITSRKEAEETINNLAYYDTLTELPNRGMFMDRLHHALAMGQRQGVTVGLLFIDLDNFKDVNDTKGHEFGDKLLKEVAKRLAVVIRESDTLARLGGDEFVVVLTTASHYEDPALAAQRILSGFSEPFAVEGETISCSASIGIALYPGDGENMESLLRCADTAMYYAKEKGKSQYQFFSFEMNQRIMHRVKLEKSLRQGLDKQEFFLHYQPKWNLKTRNIVGVEVLLRWQSADFGLMLPSEFISLTENTGLIVQIGEWVLKTACMQARKWILDGHSGMKVAVNISGRQLKQPDFLEMIQRIICETGICPETLELEFTENVVMETNPRIITTLNALKETGVQLSIDDFGTGYSCLSNLKHFLVDKIKIDQSIVADVHRSRHDAAIVEAIISMAHSLNLGVIAVGVESHDQLHFLIQRDCDEVQGFYLGIPMTADELMGNLKDMRISQYAGRQPFSLLS